MKKEKPQLTRTQEIVIAVIVVVLILAIFGIINPAFAGYVCGMAIVAYALKDFFKDVKESYSEFHSK